VIAAVNPVRHNAFAASGTTTRLIECRSRPTARPNVSCIQESRRLERDADRDRHEQDAEEPITPEERRPRPPPRDAIRDGRKHEPRDDGFAEDDEPGRGLEDEDRAQVPGTTSPVKFQPSVSWKNHTTITPTRTEVRIELSSEEGGREVQHGRVESTMRRTWA
jgi:hypothetical protein